GMHTRFQVEKLRGWKERFPSISRRAILVSSCMFFTVLTSILLRIQPIQWGFTLSEFDPFFQYETTQYVVDHGFTAFKDYHNYRQWYPAGRDVGKTSFPGVPFAGVSLYFLTRALGINITVLELTIVFPVIAAAAACVIMYYLGKEVSGEGVGLVSSFLLAVSPAFIDRTSLGFYDDECVAIPLILFTFLLYLRAIKKEKAWYAAILYATGAGLGLGYVFASWGAARYLLSLLALFTFCLFFMGHRDLRLFVSYGLLIIIGVGIAVLVPKLGLEFAREFEVVASFGVLLLLAIGYVSKTLLSERFQKSFIIISILGVVTAGLYLWVSGIITLAPAKFISVLDPFYRSDIPLLASVQEHRPSSWASYYYQFGQLVFLAPLGIFYVTRRMTPGKLLLICFASTTLYFSATLSRLAILASPAFSMLGAVGLVEILKPFAQIALQHAPTRRRARLGPVIGRGFSVFLIALLFVITFLPTTRGIEAAYSPTTLASSSIPIRGQVGDWMEVLQWMKDNLPEDAVVASWWDYGYWISIVGGKITLADNGTVNATQIAQIGRMFMSNETEAVAVLKRYNADYVVVFTTINQAVSGQLLFGDEVKWRWMAKIGWNNNTADLPLEDTSITNALADAWMMMTQDLNLQRWYERFRTYALPRSDTVLTKLMIYGSFPGWGVAETLKPECFELIYASKSRLVLVYKVK
ncbi:MAG: STT3 domain-containing protein, partial [Candidatus Bathyarchaeia archaeon]